MPRSFASSGGSGRRGRTCRGDGRGQKSRLETETPKLKGGKEEKKTSSEREARLCRALPVVSLALERETYKLRIRIQLAAILCAEMRE